MLRLRGWASESVISGCVRAGVCGVAVLVLRRVPAYVVVSCAPHLALRCQLLQPARWRSHAAGLLGWKERGKVRCDARPQRLAAMTGAMCAQAQQI